jgi:hypothetical protein
MLSRRAADTALYITIMDDPILFPEFQNFVDVFSEKNAASLSTNINVGKDCRGQCIVVTDRQDGLFDARGQGKRI